MRFSGLTILAAAFAYALGPLSALASPVDRRSLPPDHPALLEPLKVRLFSPSSSSAQPGMLTAACSASQASAAGLAPRASVIPHDLLESHLADPFKVRACLVVSKQAARLTPCPTCPRLDSLLRPSASGS